MELVLPLVGQVLNKLIDNGELTLFTGSLFVVIGTLLFLLNNALGFKVLCRQMSRYRDLLQPIIESVKVAYAYDLQSEIKAGKLTLTHEQVGEILPRHADLTEVSFLAGERYMRERLTENHLTRPGKATCTNEGCMACSEPACKEWRKFAQSTFYAHSAVVWESFSCGYNNTFFPLNIHDRKKAFQKKVPALFIAWCEMLATLCEISKNRWTLK